MNPTIDFNIILERSFYSIDIFNKYIEYQDKFLTSEIIKVNQELKDKVNDKELEEEIYCTDIYHEFYFSFLSGTFPDIQNKALLIIVFNTFENNFKNLCKLLGNTLNTPIDYTELKGDEIVKCKLFLIKLCRINYKVFETDIWKKIDCVRKIRNLIVHNDSDISSIINKDITIINYFKGCNGFTIIDNQTLGIIDSEFVKLFLSILKDFYKELLIEINIIIPST